MSKGDVRKVLAMLAGALTAVALICYARVDLGMTQDQLTQLLAKWSGDLWSLAILVWSQILVAGVAIAIYHGIQRRTPRPREE